VSVVAYLTNENAWMKDYIPAALTKFREEVVVFTSKISLDQLLEKKVDFIISDRYPYKIDSLIVDFYKGKALNLHGSFLPYNRGSYPNFFSFLENTPKGGSIHRVENSIDKGEILIRIEIKDLHKYETFSGAWVAIQNSMTNALIHNWFLLKNNEIKGFYPSEKGSFHYKKDFIVYEKLLPKAWDTRINDFNQSIKK
jgi:methionyl-tRNA formyltransferase